MPFITGQYAQTGSTTTVTPFQTIERKDVGLTLKVKPQITEGGSVRLTIYEEVSRVEDTTNAAGIITNKRSLESTVMVDDGQIIVLGGLIQDSLTDGTQKVPFLGDVPVLGALFRYDNRAPQQDQPDGVPPADGRAHGAASGALTGDRYDYLIGEQKRIRTDPNTIPPFLPNMDEPRLPMTLTPSSQLLPQSPSPLPALLPWGAPAPEPAKPQTPAPASRATKP